MATASPSLASDAIDFLSKSTDPFHAVQESVKKLKAAGFERLNYSSSEFDLKPSGKYYYVVQDSTLVAFTVPTTERPSSFQVLGGHTDSPNLKIKPNSKTASKYNCDLLNVECYGGGLWHTWFDRDLSISGRVLVKNNNSNQDKKITKRLVQLKDPIARVSTLCIHLQSADERKAFTVNKQDHTIPIIGTVNQSSKEILEKEATDQVNNDTNTNLSKWQSNQSPLLLQRIAKELQLDDASQIVDWELNFYDTQPATLGGMSNEFIYSARLDNLATVYCGLTSLINAKPSDSAISVFVAFDHEEVGSTSRNGAGSPVVLEAVERICEALKLKMDATLKNKSFIISMDQAHAVHVNYSNKHEANHGPTLNSGIVIKTNSNQRYTTNGITGFVIRELGRQANTPIQEFVVRNDCPCGSTIGPTLSALTGIATVDIGMPQLSMHSCREVMGIHDLQNGIDLCTAFYEKYGFVHANLQQEIDY